MAEATRAELGSESIGGVTCDRSVEKIGSM